MDYMITLWKKWSSHEDKINVWVKTWNFRSTLSQMFFKIGVFKHFANHRKVHLLESLFNKGKGLKTCNFIKKRLQHRCFPDKFVKLLRTYSFTEHLWWLLFGFQKIDTRLFSHQKTDTKRNPWVVIY